jgi:hypothetical protein
MCAVIGPSIEETNTIEEFLFNFFFLIIFCDNNTGAKKLISKTYLF